MRLFARRSRAAATTDSPATHSQTTSSEVNAASGPCPELAEIGVDPATDPTAAVGHTTECAECAAIGENHWSHLRKCLTCGHVACCDSSPRRHATAHFHSTGHPVMRSAEPGETWRWCYVHHVVG